MYLLIYIYILCASIVRRRKRLYVHTHTHKHMQSNCRAVGIKARKLRGYCSLRWYSRSILFLSVLFLLIVNDTDRCFWYMFLEARVVKHSWSITTKYINYIEEFSTLTNEIHRKISQNFKQWIKILFISPCQSIKARSRSPTANGAATSLPRHCKTLRNL